MLIYRAILVISPMLSPALALVTTASTFLTIAVGAATKADAKIN
jgi:hypothetical protein